MSFLAKCHTLLHGSRMLIVSIYINFTLIYQTELSLPSCMQCTCYTGDRTIPENEVISVYKLKPRMNGFQEGVFNYAKALCYLKWISVIQVTHILLINKCVFYRG